MNIECVTETSEYWGNDLSCNYLTRGDTYLFGQNRLALIEVNVKESANARYDCFFQVSAPHGEVVAIRRRHGIRFNSEYTALKGTAEKANTVALSLGATQVLIEWGGKTITANQFIEEMSNKEKRRIELMMEAESE